ncbi:phosphate ABC transporter permease PstA [Sphingoaurantiacus capsulatus]|uniref:Phosphate transport system permease protein PstA n=1 Tax=Sphingoaurantiacus capsulatus TaxID=1771310 RepID=A0ABV7XBN6_9SPHN
MNSAAIGSRAPTEWSSSAMQARIRSRYRSERLFRLAGLGALLLAAAFLAFLLVSIGSKGLTGFQRTDVKLTVAFSPAILGIDPAAARGPNAQVVLQQANYQGLLDAAVAASVGPDADGVVSEGAWLRLREALMENPSLLGMQADLWVPATSDIDLLAKGILNKESPTGAVNPQLIREHKRLDAAGKIRTGLNTTFLSMADSTDPELAGIWGAAKGSLLTLLVTLLISFPVGVLAAIYLEEYAPKNRFTDIIEVSINNLAAVPSIIFGLLGLAVFLQFFGMPRSAPLVGGLTLALMTLPVIVISGRVAIKAVPPSIRDAALGVGASPVQVVFHHVLPLALPGILTGTIIGMARALGETAPLLMIGMRAFVADVPSGLSNPATVLPVQIFLWSDDVQRGFVEKTSAAIIVLLVFLMLMNGLAIYLRNKFERRW